MYDLENSHFWFIGKRYFVDAYLGRLNLKRTKILDIGCGTGGLTKYLTKYGSVIGIDDNKIAIRLSRKKGLNIINKSANKIPTSLGKFNLITFFDVLYHKNVISPENTIGQAYKLINYGGYLLISDSAFNFLSSSHDHALGGTRRFRLDEIVNLLKKNKLTIVKSSYTFMSLFPVLMVKRYLSKLFEIAPGSDVSVVNPLINKSLLFLLKLESQVLKCMDFPVGSSVMVLARKDKK